MNSRFSNENSQNPFQILIQIFESLPPKEIINELQEIKSQLLNKSYPHEEGSIEHDNTVYFFEQMDQLILAISLLFSTYQEGSNRLN